jgi:regulatory protein
LSTSPPESAAELKTRALRLLARREHSRDELARKLSPHAESPEALESVLDFLVSKTLLSNERFAEVRAHWLARKYGAAKIRHDLTSKGVGAELAERVTSDIEELEKAKAILARKYRQPATTREEGAKRARFLQGRGFSVEVIRRLVLDKA